MALKKDALGKGLGAIFPDLLTGDTAEKYLSTVVESKSCVQTGINRVKISTTKIRRN